ncbi:MAG: class I SAM-dependent methyltransferase [Phascolarctobacterium sp.]|uniref:class I SAM-dependent methyltransferase n=1 Tax=Phascolarctobacterium sp. TaxID=2049039 RepID=UPI0026DB14B1|nr:class I SAM-dependent methyltransferase [Phascolarctobacterium sp.]MDO4921354.1 class I SAM-dependent methyltransferase [Phascolarctobacterium sp.]
MRLKKDSSEQKLRGAYYTPLQFANAMVRLVAHENIKSVLEPSCGDGVFLDSLAQLGIMDDIDSIDAVEIESDEVEKVKKTYCCNKHIQVFNEDFFKFYTSILGQKLYDLILGNPPYIRYQYLTESQRELQSKILTSHGMKSNKLINAWVAFLVACVQLLSNNGRIAFIIPAEILQVAYAEDLRLFLSEQLAKITLITFEQLVFPDIEQEVVVFIGEKGAEEKGIRIIEMNDLDSFSRLDLEQNGFQKMQHVKEKWTKYFVSADEMALIQKLRADERFAKFSDYGIINVGITTGNNSYFSITEGTSKRYHLDDVTLPLVGRSSHTHGIYFTTEDWERNKTTGKRARLINFPDTPYEEYPAEHKEYILLGEKSGEHEGYKCSIRDRWYIIPSVWVPDAFFLRRNNFYPKFVLNKCDAVSTDTMHRMKFNDGVDPQTILLAYYNSISFAFTEICGRSYGGGVLEILPSEMGNILLPKVEKIDSALRDGLLTYIDSVVRCDGDIENALDAVDNELLVNVLGIDSKICQKCRAIWKKMQKRRLGRGYNEKHFS